MYLADMELELSKYKKYSRDIKRLLIISGIWPNFHPCVQRFIAVFALSVTAMTFVAALNFCLHHVSNIMLVTQGMALVFSLFSTFMKICIFLLHHDDIVVLNESLSSRYAQDLQRTSYQPLALARFPAFANLFYTLTISVGVASLLTSVLIPALALRHGKYIPVCPSIFPFKYEPGGPVYWLLQFVEMATSFYVWTVTCGVDSVFGLYTLQVCGQLRILASEFETLSTSADYGKKLRDCIERHQMLMRARDALQRIFGVLAIWLAVTSAIIQCTLVFQVVQVVKTMSPFKIGYLFSFIALKLIQAFMYAWYGNLIAEESEMCLNAVYNAPWPGSGDNRFMGDVLVILSQKPLIFKAKGCMSLRMEIFSKIVNTSVSYFFLLQTLDEDS